MIEILFGESEAGSMKMAKGNSGEVICLGFMMDIGDIKEAVDSQYRKDLIYAMFSQEQWEESSEMAQELKALGNMYANELVRLKKYLENGRLIRIWYSDSPYSRCGFYFLCKWMQPFGNEVFAVKLPEYKVNANTIVSYQNWGEIAPEEFTGFLQYEKKLSKEELRMYAHLWSELADDNSPLRAVVNGTVIGVPEDFYDFLIWKRLTGKPVKQARLIGDILGYYPMGIGDWWYAARIRHFIRQGKIKVTEDSENEYGKTINIEIEEM